MTSQAAHLAQNRIVVRMDNWPANSQYPNGHFVRSLGTLGDLEAEIKVLLVQHDIDERIGPFSKGMSPAPSSIFLRNTLFVNFPVPRGAKFLMVNQF